MCTTMFRLAFLLLNTFNIFLFIDKFLLSLCNYPGNNALYTQGKDLNIVASKLHQDFSKISTWFYQTFIVLNPDKWNFLTLEFQDIKLDFACQNITIKKVSKEQSCAATNDIKRTFKSHLKIFGRNLIKNSMRLLELWICIPFPKERIGEFIHKFSISILPFHLDASIRRTELKRWT